ncbi:MAG: F0F1 ATP synthase subunit delta [Thiotrichales bacterium]
MSEYITAARPYAKAIFELASEAGSLDAWSEQLALMSAIAANSDLRAVLDDPRRTHAENAELFISICGDHVQDEAKNLVKLLAENDRLAILPEISLLFDQLRSEAEGTMEAEVISAQEMTPEQEAEIAESLKKRLGRDVKLTTRIDNSLLGGAIIRAGDLVIDGSLKGRLSNLSTALTR